MRAAASGVEEVSPESSRKRGVDRVGQAERDLEEHFYFRRRWRRRRPGKAQEAAWGSEGSVSAEQGAGKWGERPVGGRGARRPRTLSGARMRPGALSARVAQSPHR